MNKHIEVQTLRTFREWPGNKNTWFAYIFQSSEKLRLAGILRYMTSLLFIPWKNLRQKPKKVMHLLIALNTTTVISWDTKHHPCQSLHTDKLTLSLPLCLTFYTLAICNQSPYLAWSSFSSNHVPTQTVNSRSGPNQSMIGIHDSANILQDKVWQQKFQTRG